MGIIRPETVNLATRGQHSLLIAHLPQALYIAVLTLLPDFADKLVKFFNSAHLNLYQTIDSRCQGENRLFYIDINGGSLLSPHCTELTDFRMYDCLLLKLMLKYRLSKDWHVYYSWRKIIFHGSVWKIYRLDEHLLDYRLSEGWNDLAGDRLFLMGTYGGYVDLLQFTSRRWDLIPVIWQQCVPSAARLLVHIVHSYDSPPPVAPTPARAITQCPLELPCRRAPRVWQNGCHFFPQYYSHFLKCYIVGLKLL